jgi:hypothetical protein
MPMEEMMTTTQEEKAKRKRRIPINIWSRVFQVCSCSFLFWSLQPCHLSSVSDIYIYISLTGKHSLKKDDSLTKVMLVPPKQRMRIAHFDLRTQEEAFTVSLEGLKGVCCLLSPAITNLISILQWNINTLILESAQAREDRKKRVRSTLPSISYLNPSLPF